MILTVFYHIKLSNIFIFTTRCPLFSQTTKVLKALSGPRYDGKFLHYIIKKKLEGKRLNETLTNVVIPTFDIKLLQPVIFSSFQVKKNPTLNALLSDICIATSAAPTYLPAHYFKTIVFERKKRENNLIDGGVAANNPVCIDKEERENNLIDGGVAANNPVCIEKEEREYNLIDGGVAASNPTLLAMGEVSRDIIDKNVDLGTQKIKNDNSKPCNEAIDYRWLTSGGSTPLVDVFTQASGDMVDLHLSVLFKALDHSDKYL
ncbi:hypothetical protein Godav_003415 [Gossypium davidsonii]|uniref:Patatin n=1 Tax=Gossypium davidsonii TaxID=34287 RepID=A0A7J8SHM6_GOSDV|nr:hypothetical protein [Gossypium davidsonii]